MRWTSLNKGVESVRFNELDDVEIVSREDSLTQTNEDYCRFVANDVEQLQLLEDTRKAAIIAHIAAIFVLLGVIVAVILFTGNKAEAAGEMTKKYEGFRATAYVCPAGAKTIGYGFNMATPEVRRALKGKQKITKKEADQLFAVIYDKAVEDAKQYVGESWDDLDGVRQEIMVDMAYNLGKDRLAGFKKMKRAIRKGDYKRASAEMKDSLWYKQTGRRARHHVQAFKRGTK